MRTEIVERNLFQFDELSEEAKEKARDWWREGLYMDTFEFDCVIDDAKTIGALMGIEIKDVYWRGFSSQGDGAFVEGSYSFKKGATKAIKYYAPKDANLQSIAERLVKIQKKFNYKIIANLSQSGRYFLQEVDIDINGGWSKLADDEMKDIMRDFSNWIYKRLRDQDEYINSNESIDENIRCNEYEFLENGKRA